MGKLASRQAFVPPARATAWAYPAFFSNATARDDRAPVAQVKMTGKALLVGKSLPFAMDAKGTFLAPAGWPWLYSAGSLTSMRTPFSRFIKRTASAVPTEAPPRNPADWPSSMPPETQAKSTKGQLLTRKSTKYRPTLQRLNYRILGLPPSFILTITATMPKLVLIRHGESTWNLENRFTGWTDVPLTATGVEQARRAGQLLKEAGYEFDVAYTSVLKRAVWTLWHALDTMDRVWLPVRHDWRLNERHYGALQGLNKTDMAKQYGEAQVLLWRRSYDVPPPPLDEGDARCERQDLRYRNLAANSVPLTECLKDTVARVVPFWNETLAPAIQRGERIVIAAHGNSIRALVKYLDGISDSEIVGLNIPNGIPMVYELDECLKPIKREYLGDAQAIAKAQAAVANQGKA